MADGYDVDWQRMRSVSDAFAGQQDKPSELADTVQGARQADAGFDVGLTDLIQVVVSHLTAAMNGLATGIRQDSQLLKQQAQDYQTIHNRTADLIDQYRQSTIGTGGPP